MKQEYINYCPLKLQKLSDKQHKRIFATCRKMLLYVLCGQLQKAAKAFRDFYFPYKFDVFSITQRYTTDFGLYLVFNAAKRYLKTAKSNLRKLL